MSMVCKTCEQEKPDEEFRLRKEKGYRERSCKDCRYRQALENPNRQANISRYRKSEKYQLAKRKAVVSKYGLTIEDYNSMYEEQGGLCAACGQPETKKNKSLSIDHCHKTGVVGGLLCDNCNTVLGRVDDNPEHLLSLHRYLIEKRPKD